MINNIVLMFSPTDEKTPYEKGENITVIVFSRQPRDRWLNVSRMDQAWKSINVFIVSFRSGFDQLKIWFFTETEKVILEKWQSP